MTITADNWNVDADGDWSTAADWSTGKLPTSNNTVTISTTDVHTITHSTGSDTIDKLTVGQDFFDLSGGSLDILTTASFADGYTQTNGTLQVGAIGITGPAMLTGGASEGSTSFTVSGLTILSNYTLGGATQLAVASTADQTNQITLGDANGVGAAIKIASGATYDIAGDYGITQGAASGTITNAGTLEKGSGSGTSTVGASVTSTGTLTAASGTLELSGPTNTISGTLSGAGQIAFGGGVTTLGKTTLSVAALGLYGTATLNLASSAEPTSVFTDSSTGTTTLNLSKYSLALKGASASIAGYYGVALVTGSGTFVNDSVLTLGGNGSVEFGGTLLIENAVTIDQTAAVTLGDGSGNAPSFTNESKGVYDFTNDSSLGEDGATVTFDNLGTLEKTGTGGVSEVGLAVTNSGTISGQSGTLEFDNSLVDTGAIAGSAAVEIVGGSATLNTGATVTAANFGLFNTAALNVNTALTYAGVFDDSSNGTNALNLNGVTLTLSGASNTIAANYGDAVISGTGVLANTGKLTLNSGNSPVVVDDTAEIDNTGTINQAQTVTIGGSGGEVASIVNAAKATYNITGAYTINNGAAAGSHFDNSGAFDVNAGTGTADLATTFNNLSGGVVDVTAGALQTTGIFNNAGTISGTQFVAAGGDTYLNSATVLSVQQFDLYDSADLTLGANLDYDYDFVDGSDGTTTIDLNGHNLALKGVSDFYASYGDANVTGSGTLVVEHAGLISAGNGATVFGGTTEFEVDAAETVIGQVTIGDSSANAASMVIASAGTYDFTADVGISRGDAANSSINNEGLFEKTAGTGTSLVSLDFVNHGTITVTSGTLEFASGTLTNDGTINGTVTMDSNGDVLITAKSGGSGKQLIRDTPMQTTTAAALLVQAAAAFDPPSSGLSAPVWQRSGPDGTMLAASHALRA